MMLFNETKLYGTLKADDMDLDWAAQLWEDFFFHMPPCIKGNSETLNEWFANLLANQDRVESLLEDYILMGNKIQALHNRREEFEAERTTNEMPMVVSL